MNQPSPPPSPPPPSLPPSLRTGPLQTRAGLSPACSSPQPERRDGSAPGQRGDDAHVPRTTVAHAARRGGRRQAGGRREGKWKGGGDGRGGKADKGREIARVPTSAAGSGRGSEGGGGGGGGGEGRGGEGRGGGG